MTCPPPPPQKILLNFHWFLLVIIQRPYNLSFSKFLLCLSRIWVSSTVKLGRQQFSRRQQKMNNTRKPSRIWWKLSSVPAASIFGVACYANLLLYCSCRKPPSQHQRSDHFGLLISRSSQIPRTVTLRVCVWNEYKDVPSFSVFANNMTICCFLNPTQYFFYKYCGGVLIIITNYFIRANIFRFLLFFSYLSWLQVSILLTSKFSYQHQLIGCCYFAGFIRDRQ